MQNFLCNFSSVFNSPAFSGLYCILISLVILSQLPMHPILGVGSTRHNRSKQQQQQKTTTMQDAASATATAEDTVQESSAMAAMGTRRRADWP